VTVPSTAAPELRELLERIKRTPGCVVLPPAGRAAVEPGHRTPPDLQELYHLCGGVLLFRHHSYRWRLSGPGDLKPASA
jgi:hypothetical protein